ncbi:TadE/TadG family type IV pilus assembly protein [Rhizobium paknamense]|uniref:Flp pilus assembly protein TadG n=1 Tax=Rhizobium paknamense TaxID=1206817 RepID=A0ABU0ICF1_9HYPH|nr:TadE/TadG family type IV pilus assembly protein [Rhizobium paknamense]MDQ0455135.1 Flp pilus assembly protein TadG [Rhizobium paknamense]
MRSAAAALLADSSGNIAITFALLAVPLIGAVGISIDYARAYNIRTQLQTRLDAALLNAVGDIDSGNIAALQAKVQSWMQANSYGELQSFTLGDLSLDPATMMINATASTTVPTSIAGIFGVNSLDITVNSSVQGPTKQYLNVYFALDKSASMLLAATKAGQDQMYASDAKCAFACHSGDGTTYTYKGATYKNAYLLARAMGVQLRTDVALEAVGDVLDLIDSADPKHERIRNGLYLLGQTAKQVSTPGFSTDASRKLLKDDTSGTTSATSDSQSYFDWSLPALGKIVGSAGDGNSSSTPKKLVLMITDGVQSERPWVWNVTWANRMPTSADQLQTVITPLNPDWCADMKSQGVSIGVVYTTYLPIPQDFGYMATLNKTMASSSFVSVWRGKLAGGAGSMKRVDYIPTALSQCASSPDLFVSANTPDEIVGGLTKIFKNYMLKVRLTS